MSIGEAPKPEAADGELLVRVHATAINRADTLQRKGRYPPPAGASTIMGLECAGEVVAIGANCTGQWAVGDRVMALLAGGGYSEYATCPEGCAMPLPADMDYATAAAIPETWLTAFQLLFLVGHVEKDDLVLIHAGASGVGTALIQLCLKVGAKPIVTAGSQAKLDYCASLGAVFGANYKEGPFAPKIKEFTNTEYKQDGVDLILDCVGASHYDNNVEAVRLDGRWVLYGLMGGAQAETMSLAHILRKRLKVSGTTLRTRSKAYKAALVKRFCEEALPHFGAKGHTVIVHKVFPFEEIVAAHSEMEANANMGKIVVQVVPQEA